MTVSIIQAALQFDAANGTSHTLAFTDAVAVGDVIVYGTAGDGTAADFSSATPTDNLGSTYVLMGAETGPQNTFAIAWAATATQAGTPRVTLTTSVGGRANNMGYLLHGASAPQAANVEASEGACDSASVSAGPFAPPTGGVGLWYAACGEVSVSGETISYDASTTIDESAVSGAGGAIALDVAHSFGSSTATFTTVRSGGYAYVWIPVPASAPSGNAIAITAGTGAFRCSATVKATMASAVTQALAAATSAASLTATQHAQVAELLQPVRSALTVNAITHADTVGITARMAPVVVNATAYARNAVAAAASVKPSARIAYSAAQAFSVASRGSFSSSFTITQTNHPPVTVAITARFDGVRVALAERATAHASVSAGVDKPQSALTYTSASRVHAVASMQPRLAATYAARTANAVKALLRPVVALLRVFPPLQSLPADPRYYIALPFRAWLVQLAARTFYVAGDTMQAFPMQGPDESHVLTFDATPDLASGETLAKITGTVVTLAYGTDPDPSDILGMPIINTAAVPIPGKNITVAANCGVQVVASGGFPSTGYIIAITCTTSNPDKVLTLTGMLPVGIG